MSSFAHSSHHGGNCLICSTFITSQDLQDSHPSHHNQEKADDEPCVLLERQLSTIYLVWELLQVPKEMCGRFLTLFGNPHDWGKLCAGCTILVGKGLDIFKKIQKLKRKHDKIQKQVKNMMKVKVEEMELEDKGQGQSCGAVWEIRQFLNALDDMELNPQPRQNGEGEGHGQYEEEEGHGQGQSISLSSSFIGTNSTINIDGGGDRKVRENDIHQRRRPMADKSKSKNNTKKSKKHFKKVLDSSGAKDKDDSSSPVTDCFNTRRSARLVDRSISDTTTTINDGGGNVKNKDMQIVVKEEQDLSDSDGIECHAEPDPDWGMEFGSVDIGFNNTSEDEDLEDGQRLTTPSLEDEQNKECVPTAIKKKKRTQKKAKKCPEDLPPRSNSKYENGRLKPEFRKFPIRETLKLEQVIELHKQIKYPPFSESMTKEERRKRKNALAANSLAKLCQKYRVKEFPCLTCPEVFKVYNDWRVHTTLIGCEKSGDTIRKFGPVVVERLKCEECGMPINSILALEDHFRAAHCATPEVLNCRGCSVQFRTCTDYHKHYQEISKSNPDSDCVKLGLKCPDTDCRKAVRSSEAALQLHMKIRHIAPPQPMNECIQCKKSFYSKYLLRRHVELHAPRSIKCDRPNCNAMFTTKIRLKSHMNNVHLSKEKGAPEYPCKFCGKVFYLKDRTSRHEMLHNTEFPFLCTVCGKGFKVANYLTIHMWSHDPAMKYKYTMYKENAKRAAEKRQNNKESEVEPETEIEFE